MDQNKDEIINDGEVVERSSVKKKRKVNIKALCLSMTAVLLSCLVTFMTTYNVMQNAYRREVARLAEQYAAVDNTDATMKYIMDLVGAYYYGDAPDWTVDRDGNDLLYRAYVNALDDDYAAYMSPEEYNSWNESMSGNLVGIGVIVVYSNADKTMTVTLVFPDSPAEKAGLRPGDVILSIEGKTVSDMEYDDAVNSIKGEEGSTFCLTYKRDGKEITAELTRAAVTTQSVIGRMAKDSSIGIVTILQFDQTTPGQFKAAVDKLISDGAAGLVFDVRDNPGGDLESVLSTLSYILPKGSTLIKIISKDGEVQTREADDEHTIDLPMAVLTNKSTASAAELFTSCLRDYGKVKTVGTTTYGKGCMQSIFLLPNKGALKLTTKMYNPPIGESYHGIGIVPDILVEMSDENASKHLLLIDEQDDNQLQTAISALHDK